MKVHKHSSRRLSNAKGESWFCNYSRCGIQLNYHNPSKYPWITDLQSTEAWADVTCKRCLRTKRGQHKPRN